MTISTSYDGNWYSVVGTVSEVNAEINRINANPEKAIFGGNDSGVITLFLKIGRP